MSQECKYFQYTTLVALHLFLRGIKEGIDCFHLTYECLCSFLKRERLHNSIVWKFAEDLSPIFPYATISHRGLDLYVKDQPDMKLALKEIREKRGWDPSKYEKITAIRKSLKTETIYSLPEPFQIDEKELIMEVADSLRKYGSIESIVSPNQKDT